MLQSLITTRVRARHLVIALVAYALVVPVMFGPWPGLLDRVSGRCDALPPFDMRGYWTATDAATLIKACGANGRRAYIDLQFADLVYPAIAGIALLLTTALLLRRYGGRAWPLLLPVIAMTVFDYAENAAVWTVLAQWPHVNTTVATLGGVMTALKRTTAIVAFGIPLILGGVEISRWLWRRGLLRRRSSRSSA
jgi:hypothetical protein